MMMEDEMEEKVSSAEEEEEETAVETDEEGEEETEEEEEGSDSDGDGEEEEEAATQQAADKKNPLPGQVEEKKEADVLNLNNEVVKMRKEVKRVRALIIRKLTRQIGALRKKKGNETEVERNRRRATRLLEEIHAIKSLTPDLVTKTALQKNLSFEQVCKNPKSTISDRAIARIATHPQFNSKVENIKAAVKAFKDERMKSGKRGGKEKVQNQAGKATPKSQDNREERKSEKKGELKDSSEEGVLKDAEDGAVAKAGQEVETESQSAGKSEVQKQQKPEAKSARPAAVKSSDVKDIVKNISPGQNERAHLQAGDDESDLELSEDEGKEYFDDSTEERFHKQSSQSEESDDGDDFFVGKVSKFKKKKKPKVIEGKEEADKRPEVEKDSMANVKAADKLEGELDELESRLKSKATKLQSVFCSSLAGTKGGGGGGAGRGRGGDKFRQNNKDFSKQSKFQKQEKGVDRNPGSKYSKPCPEKGFGAAGRGRGRGRGDALRQKDHRGGGVFSHQPPQQALHPSWEASRKRKEQQGQILAFQGKKIKFDDDD